MLMKIIIISHEEAGYVSGSEGSEEELLRIAKPIFYEPSIR